MGAYGTKEFRKQNDVHEEYKNEAIAILRRHGIRVADMEDSFGYKAHGMHFLISREGTAAKTVRLITDSRISKTGNFFIEIAHHRYEDESKTGDYHYEKGWFLDDNVDVLLVYDFMNRVLYGLNMPVLQYSIDTSNITFKPNRIDKNCDTAFKLISLDQCKSIGAYHFTWHGPIPKTGRGSQT